MNYKIKVTHVPNEEFDIFNTIEEVIEALSMMADVEQIQETLENKDSDFKVEYIISL